MKTYSPSQIHGRAPAYLRLDLYIVKGSEEVALFVEEDISVEMAGPVELSVLVQTVKNLMDRVGPRAVLENSVYCDYGDDYHSFKTKLSYYRELTDAEKGDCERRTKAHAANKVREKKATEDRKATRLKNQELKEREELARLQRKYGTPKI